MTRRFIVHIVLLSYLYFLCAGRLHGSQNSETGDAKRVPLKPFFSKTKQFCCAGVGLLVLYTLIRHYRYPAQRSISDATSPLNNENNAVTNDTNTKESLEIQIEDQLKNEDSIIQINLIDDNKQDFVIDGDNVKSDAGYIENQSENKKIKNLAIFLSKSIEQKNIDGLFFVLQKKNSDVLKKDFKAMHSWPRFDDIFSLFNQHISGVKDHSNGETVSVLFNKLLDFVHFLADDFWWQEAARYYEYEKFITVFISFFTDVVARQEDFDISDLDLTLLFSCSLFSIDGYLEKKSFWRISAVLEHRFMSGCQGSFYTWLESDRRFCYDIIRAVPGCIESLSLSNDFRKFLLFEYYIQENQYDDAIHFFLENKSFFEIFLSAVPNERSVSENIVARDRYFLPVIEYLSNINDNQLSLMIEVLFRSFCCGKSRYFSFLKCHSVIRCLLDCSDKDFRKAACSVFNHHPSDIKCYCCAVQQEKQERLHELLDYMKPFVNQYDRTEDKVLVDCCAILKQFLPNKFDDRDDSDFHSIILDFIFEFLRDEKCKNYYFKSLRKETLCVLMQSENEKDGTRLEQFVSFLKENPSLYCQELFMFYIHQNDKESLNQIVDLMLEKNSYDNVFEYIPIYFLKQFFLLCSNDQQMIKVIQKLPKEALKDEVIIQYLFQHGIDSSKLDEKMLSIFATLPDELFSMWMENVRSKRSKMYAPVILGYVKNSCVTSAWEKCVVYLNGCDDKHQSEFLNIFQSFTDIASPERPDNGLDTWLKCTLGQLIERKLYTLAYTIVSCFDATLSCDFFKNIFLKIKTDISIEEMIYVFKPYFVKRPLIFVTILLFCQPDVNVEDLCSFCFGSREEVQSIGKTMDWNFLTRAPYMPGMPDYLANRLVRLREIVWAFHADEYDRMSLALEYGIPLSDEILVTEEEQAVFKSVVRQIFEKRVKEFNSQKLPGHKFLDFVFYVLNTAKVLNSSLSENELPIHEKLIIDESTRCISFAEFLMLNEKDVYSAAILEFLYQAGFLLHDIYLSKGAEEIKFRQYGLFYKEEQILEKWAMIKDMDGQECRQIMGYILNNCIKNFKKWLMRCHAVKDWKEQNFFLLRHCILDIYEKNLFMDKNKKKFKIMVNLMKFLSPHVLRSSVEALFKNSEEEKVCGGTLWGLVSGYWLLHATEKVVFVDPHENWSEYNKGKQYIMTILRGVTGINFFVKSFNHKTFFANLFFHEHVKNDIEFVSELKEVVSEKIDAWVWKEIGKQNQTHQDFDSENTIEDMLKKDDTLKKIFMLDAIEKSV